LRDAWLLDPAVNFLNHGSFGARLKGVLEAQDRVRRAVEAHPVRWMERERDARITASRQVAADFLGARVQDLAFVVNATDAVNAVVRSLELDTNDELLTTTHVYNGVRQTLCEAARRAGARYREVDIPVPVANPGAIAERVIDAITPRTRLLMLDHIASPSALVFPVDEILVAARDRGVSVFVDGAHAPGQVEVGLARLAELGATYCTGNFHKWPSAPLGSAYLWIHPEHQTGVRPTVISHFRGEAFTEEFRWQGTRDLSAWMVLPEALAALEALVPGGWDAIRGHNRDLARWARAHIAERLAPLGVVPVAGEESLVGSMAAFLLPGRLQDAFARPVEVHDRLADVFGIEAPVFPIEDDWAVRISAHVYCDPEQYAAFADAFEAILSDG
jgi:isopenicillin-N epimerase